MEIKNTDGKVLTTVEGDSLVGADLRGANLSDANLRFVNLSGAKYDEDTQFSPDPRDKMIFVSKEDKE
jgi:uncharacterized protein YjbI with pentapeptide repeats